MNRIRQAALTGALAVVLAWAQLAAQVVRGVVRDSVSGLPIAGAVVSAMDSANRPIARGLSAAGGRFTLTVSPAARRLQVLHIGHLPVDVLLPAADSDGSITIDVAMASVPLRLDAMRSASTPLCPRPPDQGAGFALWGQARAALLAAVVARDATQGNVRVLFYQRDIDPRVGVITSQTTTLSGGPKSNTSVAARSPSAFAERGYLDAADTGAQFYAPDADVLLDESFAATHCFHIERGSASHARDLGVAFAPAQDRQHVADIAGVLWIDSAAHAIRTLEYRYTGMRSVLVDGALGGTVTFRVLANGAPIIERWVIRTSPAGWTTNVVPAWNRAMGTGATRESGAELLEGTWGDSVHWKASLGTIAGHLSPAKNVQASGPIVVWLSGTQDSTVSDANGTFRFSSVLPGRYAIKAADAMVVPFGVVQTNDAVAAVVRDSTVRADVTVSGSVLQVLTRTCGRSLMVGATDLLVRVESPGPTSPATTAAINQSGLDAQRRVVLNAVTTDGTREAPVVTVPINHGIASFVVCGVPGGSTLRLKAFVGETVTQRVLMLRGDRPIDTLTLVAKPPDR